MTRLVPAGSLRPTYHLSAAVRGTRGDAPIAYDDRDRTRPFLVLHGGAGPASMAGFSELLAQRSHSRVLTPTHPGFAGTPSLPSATNVRDLAAVYVALLDQQDLTDVTVIGNSFGGWLAAEIALLDSPRVSGAILLDAIGIEVEGHPATDVAGLSITDILALSFHDPSRAPRPSAAADSAPSSDIQALLGYTGRAMSDPTLLQRLGELEIPVHVIWGASDGIVGPEYGKAYAAAIPTSTFTVLERTGHLPQVETPEELLGAIFDLGAD